MPQPDADGQDGSPPPPEGAEAPPQGAAGVEDYEQMELPPFMTPVMEELVRPPSDAPFKREAQGAEPQEDGTGEKQVEEKELPEGSAEKAMRTTEVEAGRGGEDDVAEMTASEDQDGPSGAAEGALRPRKSCIIGMCSAPSRRQIASSWGSRTSRRRTFSPRSSFAFTSLALISITRGILPAAPGRARPALAKAEAPLFGMPAA